MLIANCGTRSLKSPIANMDGATGCRWKSSRFAHALPIDFTIELGIGGSADIRRETPLGSVCKQPFTAAPIRYRINALLQLGRLVPVVVRRAVDPDIFLVRGRERCVDRRVVRSGHS